MTSSQATNLIRDALRQLAIALPTPVNEDLFLMKDLNLESVDLLNLLIEIERSLHSQIDLVQIMRGREDQRVYQRDLKFRDLTGYLEKQDIKATF